MREHDTTRVLFVQNEDACPPGHVGDRIRQRGAEVELVMARRSRLPDPRDYDLVVPLGCYDSAYDDSQTFIRREREMLTAAVESGVAVFGICFGAQLLSRVLGGQVFPAVGGPEIGWIDLETPETGPRLDSGPWLVWHLDVMTTPPDGVELAHSEVATQAFEHGKHFGVQFHPEATLDSIRSWADYYPDLLRDNGIDRRDLAERSRELVVDAQRRAYELTDRVLDRAGYPTELESSRRV